MAKEVKIPALGESITEVMVGEFYKGVGEYIEADENLVEIESEKATMDVPAPVSGVIKEIVLEQGSVANIGDTLVIIDDTAEAPAEGDTPKSAPESVPETQESQKETAPASQAAPPKKSSSADGHVMPGAARVLAENKLAAEDVKASGPGGRLLKEDVQRHLASEQSSAPAQLPSTVGERDSDVVPMSMLRRKIAERLVSAQQNAALLTTFNEVNMKPVMDLRKQYQEDFQKKYGIKLGFMSFFVKAVIDGLKAVPQVNGEVRGNDLVYHNYYDIGIAVGGGKGLVVPVVRNADQLSFAEIEQTIYDLAVRAKEGNLAMEELQGGTFTISNGGIYGSMLSTPIVNPPQSGILGLHNIQDRVVAENGEVVIRPMMYLALSYDHRIIDGREAVTFLKRVKDVIEEPSRMLIEC
ncbi:MAG: 2-oxoglutarate dehydrogenase complex dihydrolipoyllysine-residue succinyltransferase [Planctomycetaceae bacterium]|nr:2-oxoglutarate dehydrogenase complex dihydrolipoyllysine-residue succinyltransferase [Planctomycetaceae bacterium]